MLSGIVGVEQAAAIGQDDRLCPIADLELPQHPGDVAFGARELLPSVPAPANRDQGLFLQSPAQTVVFSVLILALVLR